MNILSKFKLPSSSGLGLAVFRRYLNSRIAHLMNQLVNDGGDSRTAPATPGLLKSWEFILQSLFAQSSAWSAVPYEDWQKSCGKRFFRSSSQTGVLTCSSYARLFLRPTGPIQSIQVKMSVRCTLGVTYVWRGLETSSQSSSSVKRNFTYAKNQGSICKSWC